jgi:CO/xanthine dehydrogenase Mo-binding subunit
MGAESLEIDMSKIKKVTHGDTFRGPDSGSVTASRSIYVVGNAIHLAALEFKKKVVEFANDYYEEEFEYKEGKVTSNNRTLHLIDIAQLCMLKGKKIITSGHFVHPVCEEDFGDGLPHWIYTYITQMALVSVDTRTYEVKVEKIISIPEMGKAINVQGVEQQSEGGAIMGMGYALYEEIKLDKGYFKNPEFSTYILPTSMDSPEVETYIVESGVRGEETHPYGAKGLGEAITVPICPAIVTAIYDAVKVRINSLPVTPEKLYHAMKK